MKVRKIVLVLSACALMCFNSVFTLPALAADLNSIGVSESQEVDTDDGTSSKGSSGVDISGTYEVLYGQTAITQEDAKEAARLAAPVVKVIRIAMSLILAILPVLMLFSSIVDIVCLTISPLRKAIMTTSDDGGAGAGGAGMGMGGMGMGMGGMGMGGMGGGAAAAPMGFAAKIAQFASKEAQETARECSGAPAAGGAGGMGMGGMGGYGGMGMGMGGMGGGAAAAAPSPKNLLITYFKKRTVFLVVFGVCVVVFSCTAFTDLGLQLGAWIVEKVAGISLV